MLKLCVLAAVCFLSPGNALPFADTEPSRGVSCPGRDLAGALAYTQAYRATNRQSQEIQDDDRDYRFELDGEIDDVYHPGETYEFEVLRNDDDVPADDIHHYYVLAAPLLDEQSCGHGALRGYSGAAAPKDDCRHVIEYRRLESDGTGELDEEKIAFEWTAPECGCVTISAVVVTGGKELILDDEKAVQGPLTVTLCATSSPDNNLVPTPYDNDFYGIQEEDDFDFENNLLEEVNDIISEEDEFDEDIDDGSEEQYELEEDVDDVEKGVEDSDEEEDESRRMRGRGKGRWNGKRRGKHGHSRNKGYAGKRKGRYHKIKDSEEYDEKNAVPGETREEIISRWRKQYLERQELKQRGEDRPYGPRHTKKHHKHGGRYGHKRIFYKGKKAAHLRSICQRLSHDKDLSTLKKKVANKLTPEARAARQSQRTEAQSALSECCVDWTEEDEDAELISCFTDVHEQRLEEKMCTAEADDFKMDKLPPKIDAAKEKCCEESGEERGECLMKTLKLLKRMKMQRKGNWTSDEEKVSGICKWVQKSLVPQKNVFAKMGVVEQRRWTDIFTARRIQMKECCQLSDSEQSDCLADLREERFDRVCNGKEPLKPSGSKAADMVQDVTDQCCVLEDEERYDCFNEYRAERRGCGHHAKRRDHHKHESDEAEDSDEEDIERAVVTSQKRKHRNPGKYGKKNKMGGRTKKVAFRRCCRMGRKAGNDIEVDSSESKWLTCQNEAKGYLLGLNKWAIQTSEDVCQNGFRKCCMGSAIRNAKDEAISEVEENLNGEYEEQRSAGIKNMADNTMSRKRVA